MTERPTPLIQAAPKTRWERLIRWNRAGLLAARAFKLIHRFGVGPGRFRQTLAFYTDILERHGVRATFPTTAVTLARHPEDMRRLTTAGVELAIHGLTHIDHSKLGFDRQKSDMERAAGMFGRLGITPHGFRCPYLWWNPDTRRAAAAAGLWYVSNHVHLWDAFDTPEVRSLYHAENLRSTRSLPFMADGVVEIPVSLPDDFILAERIGLPPERVAEVWAKVLDLAVRRGELMTVQLHPELIRPCAEGLEALLARARREPGRIWSACLEEVAEWWLSRQTFSVATEARGDGFVLTPTARADAVLLARNLSGSGTGLSREYQPVRDARLSIAAGPLPFVGVPAGTPEATVTVLKEAGYVVRVNASPRDVGVFLGEDVLSSAPPEGLEDLIEASKAPLVRFARWPRDCDAALCISGDLDCMTLLDYAWRYLGQ